MSEIPDKLFFKIGEVSSITELEPHILRYWESEFKFLHPRKSDAGRRLYAKRDIERILKIKKLLHEEGYTIQGAKKKLKERDEDLDEKPAAPAPPRTVIQETLNFSGKDAGGMLKEIKEDLKKVLTLLSR